MRFNRMTRIAASVAVVGAVAAGGAAFTAGNTLPSSSVAGYGTTSVTGGTVTSLTYGLSSDGANISTATIVFQGDVHTDTASIGFNGGALTTCGTGSYDGSSSTTFTCTLSGVTTASETSAAVTLTGPSS